MSTVNDISTQFRTRMLSKDDLGLLPDYKNLIKNTSVVSFWDSIVAKLDSLLSYITNGSWSESKKTVLIKKMDAFKAKLIVKLNDTLPVNIYSTIDHEIFCFMMETISEKVLSPDVHLSLKSGEHAIQLNSTDGVLAEYHGSYIGDHRFLSQDYNPNNATHIPSELSQKLSSFMSLWDKFFLWDYLCTQLLTDLNQTISLIAKQSLTELINNQRDSKIRDLKTAFLDLKNYIQNNRDECVISAGDDSIKTSWSRIVDWVDGKNVKIKDPWLIKSPSLLEDDIYNLLTY